MNGYDAFIDAGEMDDADDKWRRRLRRRGYDGDRMEPDDDEESGRPRLCNVFKTKRNYDARDWRCVVHEDTYIRP